MTRHGWRHAAAMLPPALAPASRQPHAGARVRQAESGEARRRWRRTAAISRTKTSRSERMPRARTGKVLGEATASKKEAYDRARPSFLRGSDHRLACRPASSASICPCQMHNLRNQSRLRTDRPAQRQRPQLHGDRRRLDRRGLRRQDADRGRQGAERRLLQLLEQQPKLQGRLPARQSPGLGDARTAPPWSSTPRNGKDKLTDEEIDKLFVAKK